jgi:hypothetical protein
MMWLYCIVPNESRSSLDRWPCVVALNEQQEWVNLLDIYMVRLEQFSIPLKMQKCKV